jgi:HPt (histidine-containing phosphotransfer) domain-containing protein
MEDKIVEILNNVEGISTSDGLLYCGCPAAYAKFAGTFYSSIEKKAKDIEDAYKGEDYESFTIKVHSLKSTSRIIGMRELSDMAQQLEYAGKDGDTEFIKENIDGFLANYRSYIEKLSVLDELKKDADEGKELIPDDELQDALKALAEVIPAMDYDAVEMILAEVNKYRLPENARDAFAQMDKHLKNMEWDELSRLVSEISI